MLSKENENFACKLLGVVRILSDMVLEIIFGTALLANAVIFTACYRRNKRMAREHFRLYLQRRNRDMEAERQ